MNSKSQIGLLAFLVVLASLNIAIWYAWLHPAAPRLRVSVMDIGQGDSILVQGPTGVQMLVDGGPDRSVLRQLPREMGLFDRSLDLVVETHPDKDHIAGLTDVFDRYRVSYFMSPGIPGKTATAHGLEHAAANESAYMHLSRVAACASISAAARTLTSCILTATFHMEIRTKAQS